MKKETIRIYNTYHSRARRLQRRRPLQQSWRRPIPPIGQCLALPSPACAVRVRRAVDLPL